MILAVFDLDGTIADTIEDLGDAVNYGLRVLGYPEHDYEKYKKMVGNGAPVLCFRALPDGHKDEADRLHELFREYYTVHYLDKTRLYAGMDKAVSTLSEAGVKVAVATNKPQDVARSLVAKLLPDVGFEAVLGGCAERAKKPDRAIIDEILSDVNGVTEMFMIGDSNVDIQTAQNAGMRSIGCAWGFRGSEELILAGADYIAASPGDICRFILR